ncbi:putative short chain dehydrogenase/reductase [Actinacidiphila reveromycinica]|uniref:Putative short chain dehydrogenase/reductase n=1 Tax=Actinacidiphila reveromycinica TaxID=659352 RepID=A0A7U3UR57_9ACTN|nr:SDR family oxidoreductase [Streptomyces sp. SN-593]BBA97131.1 putative short chain dehydrogenase/reductase [Streptomyces sp. SN-593]
MENPLTGHVVIVTGASSGIGEATARCLHEAGARPVLAARRADRIETLGDELGGALAVPTDVTVPEQVHALVQATVDTYGRVDGLVNNAGAGAFHRLDAITPAAFLDLLNLNVVSTVTAIQAVLPHMRAAGHGRIVNISSGATQMPMAGNAIYPAAKTAVNWLSQVGRLELADENIQLSVVLPSVTRTEFYEDGELPSGMVAHSPEYVGRVILRALRTGEERIDIPHGPEQPDFPAHR